MTAKHRPLPERPAFTPALRLLYTCPEHGAEAICGVTGATRQADGSMLHTTKMTFDCGCVITRELAEIRGKRK